MVFSSLEFLFWFLPIFLIAYFVCPRRYKNIALLAGSLVFYAFGEPVYVFLMIGSILLNFFLSKKIVSFQQLEDETGQDHHYERRGLFLLALLFDFGMLFVFKYLGFVLSVFNQMAGQDIFPTVELTLPLGISFYTFQVASYIIDVYCRKNPYAKTDSIFHVATYICMFPQLIAGPIVNYQEVAVAMRRRKTNFTQIEQGVCVLVMGLVYKVLLANKIASLWNDVQTIGPYGIHTLTAWLGSWGFSMQIYFDFFGYSLMAIGLGKILGFELPENFNDPYCSSSATEFWRRWHMTLSRWFKNYVYIPLGGNRKGIGRMIFNLFLVWFLTGFWHGANWNFLIWGMLFFILLIAEKLFLGKLLNKNWWIGKIYMFLLIPVSWTIFNISDLTLLGAYLKRMFLLPVQGTVPSDGLAQFGQLFGTYWWLLAICVFCCTPIPMQLYRKFKDHAIFKLILFILFWVAVYQIAQGADNPFLYFRF